MSWLKYFGMRIELGIINQRTDGLTDGQADAWMEGQTDGFNGDGCSDNYNYVDRGGSEMENAIAMILM